MDGENEVRPDPEEIDDIQPTDDNEPDAPDATDELDEDPEHEEIDAQPQRPTSRAENRFQKLSATAREANERASRLERELQELKTAQQRREAQQQERQPTADEMALWSEDQRTDWKLSQAQKTWQTQFNQIQWNTYESGDKAAFAALCASDPIAKKYATEVEDRLADLRSKGQNVDRERLLTFIVGEKVRQNRGKAKERQTNEGQRRIQRQQAPAPNGRGDTPSQRGRLSPAEERLKRLEDQTF